MSFKAVKKINDWDWDRLRILPDDAVTVKWPNGKTSKHKVLSRRHYETVEGHHVESDQLFVEVMFQGLRLDVPLEALEVEV